jgi:hypothetical protein
MIPKGICKNKLFFVLLLIFFTILFSFRYALAEGKDSAALKSPKAVPKESDARDLGLNPLGRFEMHVGVELWRYPFLGVSYRVHRKVVLEADYGNPLGISIFTGLLYDPAYQLNFGLKYFAGKNLDVFLNPQLTYEQKLNKGKWDFSVGLNIGYRASNPKSSLNLQHKIGLNIRSESPYVWVNLGTQLGFDLFK